MLWILLLSVLLRGHAIGLFEDASEIAPVYEPCLCSNVCDLILRRFKQMAGVLHADHLLILLDGHAGLLMKEIGKIGRCGIGKRGDLRKGDVLTDIAAQEICPNLRR